MSRFNAKTPRRYPTAIVSAPSPTARTYNQAPGFERDPRSELFLLAVSNFVSTDSHYETVVARDDRFKKLIHQVASTDPQWLARFLPWLRSEANMRTASLVGAVEFAAKFSAISAQAPGPDSQKRGLARSTVAAVLQRGDEPGEMLGYWLATYPGKQIPKSIKRGIGDAVQYLYNEYNTLKYDTASHGVRFGDVLELVHAAPHHLGQDVLFKHLIDRRHGREGIPSSLNMIHMNQALREKAAENPSSLLDTEWLRAAGMNWEDVLSLAGSRLSKKELWQALIPTMGYMALLRNLRNFDEAGVTDNVAQYVIDRLTDPDQVARSRQLPMRFLSAYRAAPSLRWSYPLEQAMNLSLQNVPQFSGRTLVLIDTSGSMDNRLSTRSDLLRWDAAAMFGLAVAQRCQQVTVVSFGSQIREFPLDLGESLLRSLERFKGRYFFGGGTPTKQAVDSFYQGQDRVIVLTDEQANMHAGQGVFDKVPSNKMAVTFNLAGYRLGHNASGSDTRVVLAGLNDQAFRLLPALELRSAGQWPF